MNLTILSAEDIYVYKMKLCFKSVLEMYDLDFEIHKTSCSISLNRIFDLILVQNSFIWLKSNFILVGILFILMKNIFISTKFHFI